MGVTIRNILEIEEIKKYKVRVIAGKGGLYRRVDYVDILEVPDVINWLRKGLLLLTTGYAFKENPDYIITLIESMAKNDCAALFIKDNRFLQEIPKAAINKANILNLPLVLVPNDVPYVEVTHPIINHILIQTKKDKELKEYLSHILADSKSMSENMIISVLGNFNEYFSFSPPYFLGIVKYNRKTNGFNFSKDIIYTNFNDTVIFLLSSASKNLKDRLMDQIYQNKTGKNNFFILISKPMEKLSDISDVYSRLNKSIEIIKAIPALKNKKIIFYDEISYYVLLHKLANQQETEEIVTEALAPVLKLNESEREIMLNTIYHYVNNLGNKTKAAENAYMHRNTFNYRIDKLTKLLNSDLSSSDEIYKYKIILDLYYLMVNRPH